MALWLVLNYYKFNKKNKINKKVSKDAGVRVLTIAGGYR